MFSCDLFWIQKEDFKFTEYTISCDLWKLELIFFDIFIISWSPLFWTKTTTTEHFWHHERVCIKRMMSYHWQVSQRVRSTVHDFSQLASWVFREICLILANSDLSGSSLGACERLRGKAQSSRRSRTWDEAQLAPGMNYAALRDSLCAFLDGRKTNKYQKYSNDSSLKRLCRDSTDLSNSAVYYFGHWPSNAFSGVRMWDVFYTGNICLRIFFSSNIFHRMCGMFCARLLKLCHGLIMSRIKYR